MISCFLFGRTYKLTGILIYGAFSLILSYLELQSLSTNGCVKFTCSNPFLEHNKSMAKQIKNDINRLIKPYPGQWVALSQDDTHVVSVGRSFEGVLNSAHKKGEPRPHIVKSPDGSWAAIVF